MNIKYDKKVSLYFTMLFAIVSSCQSARPLTNNSYSRVNKGNKFSIEEVKSVGINNGNVYKIYSTWTGSYHFHSEQKNYELAKDFKDYLGKEPNEYQFIRIQSNGLIAFYSIPKEKTITKDLFEQDNYHTCIYDIHKKVIYTKRYVRIDHGSKLVRGKIKIIGDTLHMIEKLGMPNHTKYVQVKL